MADQADEAIAYAESKIGDPYVWGATGPNSFDCSGLVQQAYAAAGVALGRTTYQQVLEGSPVTQGDLEPGDLVFPDAGHVQLYVGNGEVIEAPYTGADVREVPMWGFWEARRVATPGTAVGGTSTSTTPGTAASSPSLASTAGSALTKVAFVALAGGLAIGGLVLVTRKGVKTA